MRQSLKISRRRVLSGGSAWLACSPSAAATAPVFQADAFIDSVGVCVHLDSDPYASGFERVSSLIGISGIRHLRDELRPGNNLTRWRELSSSHGIRWNLLVSPTTNTVADMLDYIDALDARNVAAIEGQNEGDSDWFLSQPQGANWSATVVAYQRDVHRALRARFPQATLPLLSPTVIDWKPADVALIRPAAEFSDIVAIHSYVQHGQEPETLEDFAGLSWYLGHMRDAFKPRAPVMATEAGYCNLPGKSGSGVSEAAAAIYLPRLLLNNFGAGVLRTYLYEFMDGGTAPDDGEAPWGLIRFDGSPKPAFHAIRRLIAALQMRENREGRVRSPGLDPVGGPSDLRRMVFETANGSHVVAIWRAIRSWDVRTSTDVKVASIPLSLAVGPAVKAAHWLLLNDNDDWRDVPVRAGVIEVPVSDKVTLVRTAG